jgi:hypothetical protein
MNAYLWFQFGSFAYGFSGKLLSTSISLERCANLVVELDPPQAGADNLPSFVESILETSKHLLRVDLCISKPHDVKGKEELRFVSRHLPELLQNSSAVKLKLFDLEPNFVAQNSKKPHHANQSHHSTRKDFSK